MNKLIEGWYALYTMPRHEKKLHTRLSELNVTSFLPMTRMLRTWHDRKKYVEMPLFPSYIFVYLNNIEHYYNVLNTNGALYYVKTGNELSRISEQIIHYIRIVSEQSTGIELSADYFPPGKELLISSGPLAGFSCEVVSYKNSEKILVRVSLLQRSLLCSYTADSLGEKLT
ncbi:UpxY family transcription antiterminator [Chitinophaga pinensis]|uniref:NusG antitermination factor n=1 Tax=Chitinophaga pinensis (strain ATCC 43595 / DSM 2588 / LMG 13176 / NBRC 15968 / NCIMB 11800 / UQM 2034) TaxID=485918 RepID=A0A979GXL3_CHIPD|nr:UpxY family transcription antiterminator [Chitinophaga pinensis]ACU62629.1 NusG antitermination factor [Chitinophaga pinensis DSM 2588]